MIYKYKASIPGSKIFMREYEVKGDISLFDLHKFLLHDLGFVPDQMVAFKGVNGNGKITSIYGLFDMGDGTMDSVSVEDTYKKGESKLVYVYDLHNDRFIELDFVETLEEERRASYPRLVAEKGRNPDQFAKKYDDLNQFAEPVNDGGEESDMIDEEELEEDDELL